MSERDTNDDPGYGWRKYQMTLDEADEAYDAGYAAGWRAAQEKLDLGHELRIPRLDRPGDTEYDRGYNLALEEAAQEQIKQRKRGR